MIVVPRRDPNKQLIVLFADLMKDPDAGVRLTAARGLGFYDPIETAAIAALTNGLSDKDARIRVECARSLANIGERNQ